MTDRPRNQHFVPSFYLAEFTLQRSNDGVLWVLDQLQHKQWKSTPKNTAKENYFYCGDFGPAVDAFGVEETLGFCEDKWAPVIRRIIDGSCLPGYDEDDFAELMAFVAFQAMRGPGTRQYIAELLHDYSKAEALAKLANEKLWESFVNYMKSFGQPVSFTREEFLEYAKGDNYVIEVDKTWKIQQQIAAAIDLMPFLFLREWSLFMPESDAPDFVCSDSPVCVTSGKTGSTDRSIGYCKAGTVVTVPLGRRHALVGFFEGRLNMRLPAREVAGLNVMTVQNARQIFSAEKQFTSLTPGARD